MEESISRNPAATPQGNWTRWMTGLVILAAALSAAVSAQAQGHGMRGGVGMDAPGGMMMFPGSPDGIGRGTDRLLDEVGATDAQRSQVKQIAQAATADLKPQREAGRGLHAQGLQLFAAPTVDATAVEALRQQMLAQHDQASKRMVQAMLDIAKVLTPEQRAKLGERMKQRQSRMHERTHGLQRHDGESKP